MIEINLCLFSQLNIPQAAVATETEQTFMCGRYVLEGPVSRLTEYFNARYTADESIFQNSYNIAPTTQVPVVRINHEGERVILLHTWGLIPH